MKLYIHAHYHTEFEEIKEMATELETIKANLAQVSGDVKALVTSVGGLKTQVTDLTAQLAAAQAAGFDVPDDVMQASADLVAEADKAVADATTNASNVGSVVIEP